MDSHFANIFLKNNCFLYVLLLAQKVIIKLQLLILRIETIEQCGMKS